METDEAADGVVERPGKDVVFELLAVPRPLPAWVVSGSESSLLALLLSVLLALAVGDRRGIKVVLLRGPTAWSKSVGRVRSTVLLELWPDAASAERRIVEVRAAVDRGEHDDTPALSHQERRRVLRGDDHG